MSATATSTPAVAAAPQRPTAPRPGRRWLRRTRWWVGVAALVTVLVVVQVLTRSNYSNVPYSPDNVSADGTRALAQVLDAHDVTVIPVGTPAAALRALEHAGTATTLVITPQKALTGTLAAPLAGASDDLVLAGPSSTVLGRLAPEVHSAHAPSDLTPRPAGCGDPVAQTAGSIRTDGSGLQTDDPADISCFSVTGGAALVRAGSTTVLDSVTPLTNAHVLEAGNAALGIGLLGAHPTLVWLTPDPAQLSGPGPEGPGTGLGYQWAVVLLLLLGLLVWWRAVRLGPLVAERLPVVVRSDEVTAGRGRLYRRSHDTAHVAQLLRAGAITRMAEHLGLHPDSTPDAVVAAIASAADRDASQVRAVLYGPTPTTRPGLASLATQLDELDREVHRP